MATLRNRTYLLVFSIFLLWVMSACGGTIPAGGGGAQAGAARQINVVAAENFYGDIVKQIGGKRVAVTSILADPNADPHEYESSVQDARLISDADLVVQNGGGYDDWMNKLLTASPNGNRAVLTAFDLATTKLPENEHVWYSVENARVIAQAINATLKKIDARDAATFDSNLQKFDQSLQQIQQKMGEIKTKYANTPVGLTETIFLYQTGSLGLKVLTPFEFQKAVAEGNDPPADTVATVNNQVSQGQVKVLIYNEQTVSPLTMRVQDAAQARHIPLVPVTETMPAGRTYQSWMLGQLGTLEQALQQSVGA